MADDRGTDPFAASAGELAPTVAVAVALVVGFRLGLLPGGLVGIDVLLAALGWWFASGGAGLAGLRRRAVAGWPLVWRPFIAAIVLTIGWVLATEGTRLDPLVRGQVLAGMGGYANWHVLSLGPVEVLASRSVTPLQHLWALGVAAQCLLVWTILVAATRGRAARRPTERDPAALWGLVLAIASVLTGLALAATGASGQALLVSLPPRAVAFLLGAAFATAANTAPAVALRSIAVGVRWIAAAALALLAVAAGPGSDLGRWVGVVLVPLLAVIVVVAAVPGSVAADAGAPVTDDDRSLLGWGAAVAAWMLVAPSIALVRALAPDASAWLVGIGGLVVAAVAVGVVVASESWASEMPVAVERRRVLVPPLVVALLVALFSVTGAFHWEAPQPRDQWEASAPR